MIWVVWHLALHTSATPQFTRYPSIASALAKLTPRSLEKDRQTRSHSYGPTAGSNWQGVIASPPAASGSVKRVPRPALLAAPHLLWRAFAGCLLYPTQGPRPLGRPEILDNTRVAPNLHPLGRHEGSLLFTELQPNLIYLPPYLCAFVSA